MAPSLYRFIGKLYPGKPATKDTVEVELNFNFANVKLKIDGQQVILEFITESESFDKLFLDVDRTMKAFVAAQALSSYFPLQIIWDEWLEFPLDTKKGAENKPVRGKIRKPDLDQFPISTDVLLNMVSRGSELYKEFESNPYLKRALLDFNYALQQPTSEVPVYLYRAIESAQCYFGGEKQLIEKLRSEKAVKLVKQMANDAERGFHARHAAKTEQTVDLNNEDIQKAVEAASKILMEFYVFQANVPR